MSRYIVFLCLSALSVAAPHDERRQLLAVAPTVIASHPKATYIGSSSLAVDSFKGIPFAVPPVGTNRLTVPRPITTSLGTVKATGIPLACPQQALFAPNTTLPEDVLQAILSSPLLQKAQGESEDCLTLNIQRPSGTKANAKLPVVFWIFGGSSSMVVLAIALTFCVGGFELGSTQIYDGSNIIRKSVSSGTPIMYVAVNYRVSGWGFLAGKEVKAGGVSNLGLLDQRLGLKWVADNIAKFGGDPSRVTIWGESAGSISVFDQMALYGGNNLYKGKPLFYGAVMDSGSIVPANPVDGTKGQAVYNQVVAQAGCSAAADTLKCLRNVPYNTFSDAVNSLPGIFSYNSIALSYLPRPDGHVLPQSPEVLLQTGRYAKVPFMIGDQEDEGTLFSLVQSNVSTTAQLVTYLHKIFFPEVPRSRIAQLVATYPAKVAAGSPFRTGQLNELYPGFKRIAALLGDITFTLSRRAFLNIANTVNPSVPSWSYLASYFYGTPVLGTFHGSDILIAYGNPPTFAGNSIMSYYISFFNTLNPNTGKDAVIPTCRLHVLAVHAYLTPAIV